MKSNIDNQYYLITIFNVKLDQFSVKVLREKLKQIKITVTI